MDGGSEVAKRGERVAAILGHVVWLMSQSPKHKHLALADMDWLVVPALLHRQFKLYRLDGKPFAYGQLGLSAPDVLERLRDGEGRLGGGWRMDVWRQCPVCGCRGVVRWC